MIFQRFSPAFSGDIKRGEVNLIGINWIRGASNPNYTKVVERVPIVGEYVFDLIKGLIDRNYHKIVLIGHSLGAQSAGYGKNEMKC